MDADHRLGGAGHAQVGDKAQAFGEHLGVGGGHVGVGAPQGLDPPIQVPGHGPLLAGGLGVEVHQGEGGLPLLQNLIHFGEGIVEVGVHAAPANEVDHPDGGAPGAVEHPPAPAGGPAGVVGGAENVGAALHLVHDLALAPGVVAHGDHVRPGGEDVPGLLGHQTVGGGVFPVDHGEVDVILAAEGGQVAAEKVHAALPHHIPDGQNVEFHKITCCCGIYESLPLCQGR